MCVCVYNVIIKIYITWMDEIPCLSVCDSVDTKVLTFYRVIDIRTFLLYWKIRETYIKNGNRLLFFPRNY